MRHASELGSHQIWTVSVDDGTESKPISKRCGKIGDYHIPVALSDMLAPFQQPFQASLASHPLFASAQCSRKYYWGQSATIISMT